MCGDLLTVEPAIFYEDLIRPGTGDDHPRHVDSRHITLQRDWIADRAALLRRKLNSHGPEKVVIGVVSSQGKHKIVLDRRLSVRGLKDDVVRRNFLHSGLEVGRDVTVLNAVLYVRQDP